MPLAFFKGKKKRRIPLGMNRYKGAHYLEQNRAKKEYSKMIRKQDLVPMETPIKIEIVFFAGSKRRIDLDNRCVIHSKFLGDALQEHGVICDDTCKEINNIEYIYGGIDRENPRVEITLIHKS